MVGLAELIDTPVVTCCGYALAFGTAAMYFGRYAATKQDVQQMVQQLQESHDLTAKELQESHRQLEDARSDFKVELRTVNRRLDAMFSHLMNQASPAPPSTHDKLNHGGASADDEQPNPGAGRQ